MGSPEPGAVQDQLQRILASEVFIRSEVHSRFLRVLVSKALAGETDELKEQCLGVEVFGRVPSYDTVRNSIVRTQASLLRKRLSEYYDGPGASDPVIIHVPAGGYVPLFSARTTAAPVEVPSQPFRADSQWPRWMLAASFTTIAVATAYWYRIDSVPPVQVDVSALTHDTGFTGHPAVSRDGEWLSYTSDREGSGGLDIWVQRMRSSTATRLTTAPEEDTDPDFSPDGEEIVFRSRRKGGGIWVVPTRGGPERQITTEGYVPRFNPAGTLIAYSAEGIYVVPRTGGRPIRVDHGVSGAAEPVWSPTGGHILYSASGPDGQWDWWTSPVVRDDSPQLRPAAPTGLRAMLSRQTNSHAGLVSPGDWRGDEVIFSDGTTVKVVRMGDDRRVRGPARTVLNGSEMVSGRFAGTSEEEGFVYCVRSRKTEIVSLWPHSPSAPEPASTDSNVRQAWADTLTSLSADGQTLAWASHGSGIRVRRLTDSQDLAVSADRWRDDRPLLNPAGTHLIFLRRSSPSDPSKPAGDLFLVEIATRVTRRICHDCGSPVAWSPDGRLVLMKQTKRLVALGLQTGQTTDMLAGSDPVRAFGPSAAAFSPDGRWLALSGYEGGTAEVHGYVVPFSVPLPTRNSWRAVTKEQFDLQLAWSSDGNRVFTLQVRDGFRDLWSWPLDPQTKHPAGPPSALHHFHRFQRYPNDGGVLSSGGGRIAVTVQSSIGNIWQARVRTINR